MYTFYIFQMKNNHNKLFIQDREGLSVHIQALPGLIAILHKHHEVAQVAALISAYDLKS